MTPNDARRSYGAYQVVLGVADDAMAAAIRALLAEAGEFRVLEAATTAGDLVAAAGRRDVDAILLHEDLGPLPVMDLVRDIGARHPEVAMVVIVRDGSAEVLRAAMEAGARAVLTLPLSLEDLHGRLTGAALWSRAVRSRLSGQASGAPVGPGAMMVAVAGAKGGVGTTTVAVHLALEALSPDRARRVCLVDLDLQAGDVAHFLDIGQHRRSVVDLVEVVDDINVRHLEDTVFVHASGLGVLLAPWEGERAEDVKVVHARRILGTVRSSADVVVVDCGTTLTEATSAALEMADTAVLVVTPDVPALRAAGRLLRLWERLDVRKEDDVIVVVNRVSRKTEVQPDVARRVVGGRLAATTVPAAFRHLEAAANTSTPDHLDGRPVKKALGRLADELGIVPTKAAPPRSRWRREQGGQVALEMVSLVLVVAAILVVVVELALFGLTHLFAGHAATEAARRLAVSAPVSAAALDDLPGGWRRGASVAVGSEWVEVGLDVPLLLPGSFSTPIRVTSRAGTVREPGP